MRRVRTLQIQRHRHVPRRIATTTPALSPVAQHAAHAFTVAERNQAALTAADALALQRAVGNAAVSALLGGATHSRNAPPAVQRFAGPDELKVLLPPGAYNALRAAVGENFAAVMQFLGGYVPGTHRDELRLAYDILVAEGHAIAAAQTIIQLLAPHLPRNSPAFHLADAEFRRARAAAGGAAGGVATAQQTIPFLLTYLGQPTLALAQSELAVEGYNVAAATAVMQYYGRYLPPGSPAFQIAQEQLARTRVSNPGQATTLAAAATDFLVGFMATSRVLGIAKTKLQEAGYDVTKASAAMQELQPFNYDAELKTFGEQRAQEEGEKAAQSGIDAAEKVRKAAHDKADSEYSSDPRVKAGRTTKAGEDKEKKKKAADAEFKKAEAAAKANAEPERADFLKQLTDYIGSVAANIDAEDLRWMLTHPAVRGNAAIAARVAPLFTRAHTRALGRPLADWALGLTTDPPLADMVRHVCLAIGRGVGVEDAKSISMHLVKKQAAATVANGLIAHLAACPDPPALLKLLVRREQELAAVESLLAKTPLTMEEKIALAMVHEVRDVNTAVDQMATSGLGAREDAEHILSMLEGTAGGEKVSATQVAGLLAVEPAPKKVVGHLRKRQKDPLKLTTMLTKIRQPAVAVGAATTVDKPKVKQLAAKDVSLHTKRLLDLDVDPQLLIDSIDATTLPPKRLAEITEAENTKADAEALINYAYPLRTEIDTLLNKSAKDKLFVKRMHSRSITQAEAATMAKFSFANPPKEATIQIVAPIIGLNNPTSVTARMDHFAERHTYKYQDLSAANTGNDATMWPDTTDGGALTSLVRDGARNATANFTLTGARRTTANGTAAAIRFENWSGVANSVTQFYPETGTTISAADLQRFKYVFNK